MRKVVVPIWLPAVIIPAVLTPLGISLMLTLFPPGAHKAKAVFMACVLLVQLVAGLSYVLVVLVNKPGPPRFLSDR